MSEHIKYKIEGMTCALCPLIIENLLKKIKGIKNINISYAEESLSLDYDSNVVSLTSIKKKISSIGYDVIEFGKKPANNKKSESYKLKRDLIISLILISPMIILMFIGGSPDCCITLKLTKNTQFGVLLENLSYKLAFLRDWRLQFVLATLIQFGIGKRFYKKALGAIKSKILNMDVLVAAGTTVTYFFSIYMALFTSTNIYGNKEVYFESSMFVITLVLFGKYLEDKIKNSTKKSMNELIKLKPNNANLFIDGKEKVINVKELKKGDIIIVHKGQRIPCDGVIIKGSTTIDESNFTGESRSVNKKVNDNVIESTINLGEDIILKALKVGKETKFSEIVRLVEEAQNSVAPVQKLVDKVSGFFVPIVFFISIITFLIWFFIIFKGAKCFLPKALLNPVSVLVVSCPCALGLATPTGILCGTLKCTKEGILIKNSESIERIGKIDTVVFDKTGTITTGNINNEDEIRKEIYNVFKYLKKNKLKVIMVTGDKKENALNIAEKIGIENVIYEVLPNEKGDIIKKLNKEGKHVLMVGDGVNDAVALSEAEIGMVMGSGTDIALESGDIVLLNNNLNTIIKTFILGKK